MITLQGNNYNVLEVYNNSITLPDSFAAPSNKYGKGHGEAKLYIGNKTQMNNFFSTDSKCFVLKEDFIHYRNSLSRAQSVLTSIYKKAISGNKNFNFILKLIDSVINSMQNKEDFVIKLMNNLNGPRGYINSMNKTHTGGYYCLRACCIPFVSFIRIIKLEEVSTGEKSFYIKIFPSFDEMYNQVQYIKKYGHGNILSQPKYRLGQSKYKKGLVQVFNECPFTHIKDERLLVASHIQPFASCKQVQKYDIDNGLLLSPLYDKLFDRGFITFDQNGELKKSMWLSTDEWEKIALNYNISGLHLTPGRKTYLLFHEKYVFLG